MARVPHPELDAEIAAWDPLPTDLAAYGWLRSAPAVRGVTVVGHSMGNIEVLGLLSAGVPLDAAVMMGAALRQTSADEEVEEYWDQRFFGDQGITAPPEGFPVREIRRRYIEERRYVFDLPATHAPVRFVQFGVESPVVVGGRDQLYDLLPGRKEVWDLPDTTHYLSTEDWRRMGPDDQRHQCCPEPCGDARGLWQNLLSVE